ncbi:pitrilysin family protein [Roseicyclus sp. F158]|uniref:Pitrilysin family protein n=1 Tax=Tropicimonas omnivorans TaxID=3075590 RepID=A0ABU3DBJ3_9RHOB|nr:pitrilysin family protein [Roseicyclus sp. F158]MDT0681077.1 pitrilysin family protein [Roseicyclus sp. F158]
MTRLPGSAALVAAALAPGLAQAVGEVTDFTLENGMEVVVIEDHRAPVAVNMVWYEVGAADEPAGKSGIAHFLEHLMFKGTDEMESGEFSQTVALQGGSDNAFTSWDYTGYYQRVAADRLDLMMQMEADRMTDLVLTDEVVLPERDVILEERNQRVENDPGALFGEQRRAAQFLNHPYGIPVIGWRHEMEELSRQDALDFYGRYYAPNNAILVVAGDVEPDEVRDLAETHFGPIPANPDLPERTRPQEPPQLAARHLEMTDPRVAQPAVMRTYTVPERDPGDQEEAAALTLLAALLGGSRQTSLMARTLELEEAVALYTSAYYDGTSVDDASFSFAVVPADGRSLEEAEADIDRVIDRFLEEGVDAAQFERIKSQVRAGEIYARDSLQGLARRYGEALAVGLTVEDVQAWPDILEAVTREDVMAAAQSALRPAASVTGYLSGPETMAEAEPTPAATPDPAQEEAGATGEEAIQ